MGGADTMPMKPLILAACVMCALTAPHARAAAWQPSPAHRQIPIWPGAAPDAVPNAKPESVGVAENLVAGKPWLYVHEVVQPTMTVYPPQGTNTGAAVVVFPGGGYMILA